MRTLENLEMEFSHLDFDEDPNAAVEEGLILFSELICVLYAPGRVPKPHIIAAIIVTLRKLYQTTKDKKFNECEQVFDEFLTELESMDEPKLVINISEHVTKEKLLDSIFKIQTWLNS